MFGGYVGIICMIISIGYIYGSKGKKGIISNVIGLLCFSVNYILWPNMASLFVPSGTTYGGIAGGYVIGLISLVIFFLSFLFLFENRKSLQGEQKKISNEEITEKERQFCPSCGAEITDPTSTFCNKCGSPLKIN
jgi:hypothetical protein